MSTGSGERVLVFDRDEGMRQRLCEYLSRLGYRVDGAGSEPDVLKLVEAEPYAAVVVDVGAEMGTGRSIMAELQRVRPKMPVIVMSGAPSVRAVIAALRQGAFDYIIKPYEVQDLAMILPRAVERGRRDHQQFLKLESAVGAE